MRAVHQGAGRMKEDDLTLVVAGLPPEATDMDGQALKGVFRGIEAMRFAKNKEGKFKGVAFIVFKTVEALKAALDHDGDEFRGSVIEVRRPNRPSAESGKGEPKGKTKGGG